MAGENKQLGVLQLNSGNVLNTIKEVNTALQSLGKGVDLDLTNLLNAKVNTQLQNLKKQIDEVSKAATGRTTSQSAQIKEASRALTEMINLEAKMVQKGATQSRVDQYNSLAKSLEKYNQSILKSAENERNVINATNRLQDANRASAEKFAAEKLKLEEKTAKASVESYTSAIARQQELRKQQYVADVEASKKETEATLQAIEQRRAANQKEIERDTEMTLNALEQKTEAVRKAAKTQDEARKQQWQDDIKASKQETEATLQAIEQKRAANKKASEQETEMTLAAQEMRTEAIRKAAQEQEAIRKQQWQDDIKAFKKNTEDTVALIEKKHQANVKAQEEQVKSATQVYKEQLEIEKKLASGTAGTNETAVLQTQLAEKQAAFASYGKSIQEAAKADASVVKAQQDLALTQAQAQDKILKEQQKAQEEAARAAQEEAKKLQDYQKKWTNTLVSIAGAASLAVLKKQWSEAINYATEYYDRLNEIRVVTMKTESEAKKIGQDMRNLAKEMKVTSTELSKAAVTFYRQGLTDSEVQDRLKWVTEYAKIANIEFDEAAQLMTSAINTMGDSIEQSGFANVVEHIADVWLYLGDNAATSGEEIGKAMQKASASAQAFGLSFEWLGTYIATVSEQTRQAPEQIGTAFNTMFARMHQIKAKGFNDDDAKTINDVAKALATINVDLMNSEGEWRNMSDIYSDVAKQWSTLNDDQRAYIATTMAGVKQQNVFYALMNDLSKGVEGGSRAWELYTGAMEAAGTATEKYSIWKESIEASQSNMTNSLEQLYSNLQPDLIKGFYDMIALLVTGLNNLGGVIPVVIAGIAALATTIKMATTYANPLVALMAGAAAALVSLGAMGGFGLLTGDLTGADKYEEAVNKITESQTKLASLQSAKTGLNEMLAQVQSGAQLTTEEISKYSGALETVASISPTAAQAVQQLTGEMKNQSGVLDELIEKTEAAITDELAYQQLRAKDALRNYKSGSEYSEQKDITTRSAYNRAKELMGSEYSALRIAQEAGGTLMVELANVISENGWVGQEAEFEAEIEAAVEVYFKAYEQKMISAASKESRIVIDRVISALGQTVTSSQREYLGAAILDILMDGDGKLDYEDVAEERIREIWNDLVTAAEKALEGADLNIIQKIMDDYGLDLNPFQWDLQTGETDAMGGAVYAVEELSSAAVDLVYSLLQAGIAVGQIEDAFSKSYSLSDFITKLGELKKATDEANSSMGGESGTDSNKNPVDEYVKNIAKASTLIDKIKSLQETISKGEAPKLSDLMDVAEVNPEIIALSNNLGKLKEKLDEIQQTARETEIQNLIDMMRNDEGAFANSKYAQWGSTQGITTFAQLEEYYTAQYGKDSRQVQDVGANLRYLAERFLGLAESGKQAEEELTGINKFLSDVEKFDKAKSSLDILLHPDGKSAKEMADAWKAIKEVFPDISLGTTTVKEVQDRVNDLGDSVKDAAGEFGEFGEGIVAAMTEGSNAVKLLSEELRESFLSSASQEGIASYIKNFFGQGNVDWTNRKRISYQQMLDYGWNLKKEGVDEPSNLLYATKFGQTVDTQVNGKDYIINVTPILPDGQVLTPGGQDAYVRELSARAEELNISLFDADKIENGGKGILYYVDELEDSTEEAKVAARELAEEYDIVLSEALNVYDSRNIQEIGKPIADEIDNAKMALDGYKEVLDTMADFEWTDDMFAYFQQLDDSVQSGLLKTYKGLAAAMYEVDKANKKYNTIQARKTTTDKEAAQKAEEQKEAEEELAAASEELDKVLAKTKKLNDAKYFKNTAKAILEVEAGSKSVTEALSTFHSEEEKVIEAQLEYIDVSQKFAEKTEVTKSDVSALAEVLGWTPQAILDNWDMIAPMMDDIQKSMEDLRSQFQEALWLNIVGSSDVDFSDVINGLVAVQDTADAAVQALLATGEFEIEEKDLEEGMNYFAVDSLFPFRGHWETASAKSTVQILKPKGSSGLQKTGGGGGNTKSGGGGGGGGNKNEESEVTKMLNRMQEVYDLQKHLIDLYSAQASYYSETGQLQGVIKYYEKEKKAVEDQNKTIEEQMAEMEPYLKQKQKEIKSLDEASDEYKECKSDLEKLQKQHQSYAIELVNNKTKVEQLTKAIQEQQDAIRQLEIDIENELLQAIQDREELAQSKLQARIKLENEVYRVLQQQEEKQKRMLQGRINLENEIYRIIEEREALQERMLQGRIDMENTILDLLKQNAETERDLILENAQDLIDALQKERDLLSEQLRLRKELAEEQDKEAKLAELEEKYARISADPTRQKEALSIRKQIDDLRDELGWDRAEKEVKARQKEIDDQIAELNKYIKKVESYYDELFKYPEELIAQMQEILTRTDDEIIEWLKANDASYATSTEATQRNMVNTWKSSLRDMHGQTVTYWDEVSKVIEGTDDEILAWLMANDQTYQNSSAATRENLLNGWKGMLSDMHGYNDDLWGQVEQIMEEYGDSITQWLEENDEEFAQKTKAQQEDMRKNWADMLREMKGDIVTYWDEVHSIMEQGDDAIIAFLKNNSAKYRAASSAQASAYVDGWMEKLSALKSALASVSGDLIPVTTYTTTSGISSSSSSSSSGGGGGGGGGPTGSGTTGLGTATVSMIYKSIGENKLLAQSSGQYTPPTISISGFIRSFSGYTYHHSEPSGTFMSISSGGSYSITYWYSKNSTQTSGAILSAASVAASGAAQTVSSLLQTAASVKPNLQSLPIKTTTIEPKVPTIAFDTGGVPSNEGYAYVHAKERILNPYQTELFESLVNTMDIMSHIMSPGMPDFHQESLQNSSSVSVGDIIVNVDKMDTDADYDEMAEKVLNSIMEKLNRGSVIGGIRFSR